MAIKVSKNNTVGWTDCVSEKKKLILYFFTAHRTMAWAPPWNFDSVQPHVLAFFQLSLLTIVLHDAIDLMFAFSMALFVTQKASSCLNCSSGSSARGSKAAAWTWLFVSLFHCWYWHRGGRWISFFLQHSTMPKICHKFSMGAVRGDCSLCFCGVLSWEREGERKGNSKFYLNCPYLPSLLNLYHLFFYVFLIFQLTASTGEWQKHFMYRT